MHLAERYKKISDYINSEKLSIENDFDICHYTDADGLLGIIKNSSLRFTNKAFLNDVMEESYWKEIVSSSIDRIQRPVLNTKIHEFCLTLLNRESEYIFSTSTEINSINQWHYGDTQGYGIIFSKDSLGKSINQRNVGCTIGIVNYDQEIQKNIIDFIIEVYANELMMSSKNGNDDNKEKLDTDLIIKFIKSFLSMCKQPCHSVENEIRYIVHCDQSVCRFRNRKGIITPYCELNINLPIKKIIIGPGNDQDTAETGLRSLLHTFNRDDIIVTKFEAKMR